MMFNNAERPCGKDRQTDILTPLSPMAQNLWKEIKAATMSGREGSPKISLALLKGRTSNQSVPSISFRFDPSAENLTQVSDQEEEDDEVPTDITSGLDAAAAASSSSVGRAESLREASPVKETISRALGKRSSSLDSSAGPVETIPPPPPPKATEGGTGGGGLLSRLTKTFEDKINEIRKDKEGRENRDRLYVSEGSTESEGGGSGGSLSGGGPGSISGGISDRSPTTCPAVTKKDDDSGTPIASGSPPKTKTTLVQDITEHTSKIKSELGSIRPKLSELRQRRASKESTKGSKESKSGKDGKGKSSVFTSLLGRDEGLNEEMLLECDEGEVDRAEEATETATAFLDRESATPNQPTPMSEAPIAQLVRTTASPTLRTQVLEVAGQVPITRPFLYKFLIAVFIIGFVLPLPPFVSGLLVGVMLSGLATHCLLHFLAPSNAQTPSHAMDDGPVLLTLPVYEDKQLYKGWMNKLEGEYSPETYHVSLTHSVLLRLQGSRLKMDFPRGKVPKHARLNEEIRNLSFTHHLEYDLAGCQVMLLPKNLPRRWLWSRKYPICIQLQAWSKDSSPSPVSINSTPAGSAQGSPMHFASPGPPPTPPSELGRQGSSESGGDNTNTNWSLENHHNRSSGEDDLMSSSLDMASFEEVTQDMCQEKSLILFARCDREKDDWFRRLVAASELPPSRPPRSSPSHKPPQEPIGDTILLEGIPDMPTRDHQQEGGLPGTPPEMTFERYMARLLYQPPTTTTTTTTASTTTSTTTTTTSTSSPAPPLASSPPDLTNVAWVNALAGRIFYDFLRNPFWANKVQERVQRKLSKLHVPYFVGDLVVCGVHMGSSTPQLHAAGTPHLDARGLWVDLKVEYSGNFTLSLETKLDLMKLKRTAVGLDHSGSAHSLPPSPGEPAHPRVYTRSPSSDRLLRNLHFDTDTDDSVESSSEEEEEEEGAAAEAGPPTGGSGPTSRRLLRLVDTVAASRYFQHAAEWRLLQRALVGVSNTRIELSVEVRHLAGTLALNVPPPPTDRLWYGFRGAPVLTMVARPRLGDRALSLPILVEFIQKQLKIVFEKVFVLPNMDDLVIPIMSPLLPGQHVPPRPPWETAAHPQASSSSTQTHDAPFSPPQSPPRAMPQVITPIVKFTPSSH